MTNLIKHFFSVYIQTSNRCLADCQNHNICFSLSKVSYLWMSIYSTLFYKTNACLQRGMVVKVIQLAKVILRFTVPEYLEKPTKTFVAEFINFTNKITYLCYFIFVVKCIIIGSKYRKFWEHTYSNGINMQLLKVHHCVKNVNSVKSMQNICKVQIKKRKIWQYKEIKLFQMNRPINFSNIESFQRFNCNIWNCQELYFFSN